MARPTKSIRWRFMLWLAFLLVGLLIGFGVTAYELVRTNQDYEIYQQLQRRLSAVAADLSAGPRGGPPGRLGPSPGGRMEFPSPPTATNSWERLPNQAGGPPSDPPAMSDQRPPPRFDYESRPELQPPLSRRDPPPIWISAEALNLFDQSDSNAFYFVIWNYAGHDRLRSSNAPPHTEMVPTLARASGPQIRTYAGYVESFLQHNIGYRVLVGRSIAPELTARREFALWLLTVGIVVLAVGLCGSWWLAGRALRPVENIGAAASRISAGNLSERINVSETHNELGQLAATLNSTFARLEAAFAQQKQFTADASHELRTPLAVLISEAQTTLARKRTAEEYRETVAACLDTAQQMRQLTESLLALARFDAGQEQLKHQTFDLAETARAVVESIHPLADKRGIRIHSQLAPVELTGDAASLSQVISNLLTNAIHYNKTHGEIQISTRQENKAAILTVADTGPGIAPEDLPHIFERFYRADKSRSHANAHSGLGLAICQAIVEAHSGNIRVRSTPGVGTEFTVTLPQTKVP